MINIFKTSTSNHLLGYIFVNLFLNIFIYEQQLVVCIPMGFIQMTELSVQSIFFYKMTDFL